MRKIDNQRGFSLTEILVVLVIMGLLVGLVGPRVMGYLSSSRADTATAQIQQLSTAVELYTLDMGAPPSSQDGLNALVSQPAGAIGWNGPYLRKNEVPLDPWGAAYLFSSDSGNGSFTIRTLGADKTEGGEGVNADISG